MKEPIIYLIVAGLLTVAYGPTSTAAMYKNICRLFANNAKLRDPYACNAYIVCTDSVGVSTQCPKGQLFSVDSGKCVASTAGCDDPCAPDFDDVWIADEHACNGYHYCRNGTGTFGACPNDLVFDQDKQECVYKTDFECGGDNYCQIVPNSINFKNEEACDKYYTCKKRVLTSTKCKTNLLYSRESAKCVDISTNIGCDSLPTDVCIKSLKVVKNKFVDDKATCRGYYYCRDNGKVQDDNPIWGQCPEGLFFSYSDQRCVDPVDIKCVANRCEGRPDGFVNSAKDCTHYLVCKDGKQVEERQCAGHRFFDEKRQACTSDLILYKACL